MWSCTAVQDALLSGCVADLDKFQDEEQRSAMRKVDKGRVEKLHHLNKKYQVLLIAGVSSFVRVYILPKCAQVSLPWSTAKIHMLGCHLFRACLM